MHDGNVKITGLEKEYGRKEGRRWTYENDKGKEDRG
jgi:hypothetical protein